MSPEFPLCWRTIGFVVFDFESKFWLEFWPKLDFGPKFWSKLDSEPEFDPKLDFGSKFWLELWPKFDFELEFEFDPIPKVSS